jgi:UDP-N-acetylmuramate--alanine ligase
MLGIGGVGVSALARILAARGNSVTGCDNKVGETLAELREAGIPVWVGHDPAHLAGRDLVVYSAAVPSNEPELEAARAAGLRTCVWRELLAGLFAESQGVAVAGTSGKTTATHMLGAILAAAGWDPTVLVGDGRSTRTGGSRWFVAEVDESDRSLTIHHPEAALVLNVDFDHPDHFRDLADTRALFGEFMAGLPKDGLAVVCAEDPWLPIAPTPARRVSYGIDAGDYRWSELGLDLHVPGRHNRLNATGAAATALELGVPRDAVARALAEFRGAHRRLERVGSWRGAELYDDYGHTPVKVAATLQAARELVRDGGRLVLVFQPHRYSRFARFRDEFPPAWAEADAVVVTEIYSAGEPNPGALSAAVYGDLFAPDVHARLEQVVRPGDLVVFMGAGDIGLLARELAEPE